MTPSRLFDFIYFQLENFPQQKAFADNISGSWRFISTADVIEMANNLSRGLIEWGVMPGDKIAMIVCQNRVEWVIADIAIQQVGAINVPIYPTISLSENTYIFKEAEVKLCFVDNAQLYQKIERITPDLPTLQAIYTFDELNGKKYWKELFSRNRQEEVDKRKSAVKPEDLATIIYTSGTTGEPKGVMLSHKNVIASVKSVIKDVLLNPGDRTLSFLPLCHIFERTGNYFQTYRGCNIHFAGVQNLGGENGDIQTVKPHFFNTVPRVLEKIYEKICNAGSDLTGEARKIFDLAVHLTQTYDYDKELTEHEKGQWALADQYVFSRWREALGGSLRGAISGAAPLPVRITQVFRSAGIDLKEGYGLTETSPGLSLARAEKGAAVLGTVGPAVDGVELMIDESSGNYKPGEGEILACGENIMMGYYKKPKETEAVFKEIGGKKWFCTGDIGHFIDAPNGSKLLKITDRKKELLKTSGGKYVAPAPIENRLTENFLIEHAMVVGDKRKFVSALILPSTESLRQWCEKNGVIFTNIDEVVNEPRVISHFEDLVRRVNEQLSHIEKIKKFTLVASPWLPIQQNGSLAELTPTLKLKRRVIASKYKELIEKMYEE